MLMKSLTFFSLVAARASQVYTKTVNSGLFTRFTRPHKDRKRWLILMEGIIQGTRTFNNSDLKLQHLTRRRTDRGRNDRIPSSDLPIQRSPDSAIF